MPTKKKVGYASYRLSPLKQITSAAQAMRKKQPSMPWKTAVAKASKQYNSGTMAKPAKKTAAKKAAPKKKAAVKKSPAKKTARKKSSAVRQGALFGIGSNMYSIRDGIEREISRIVKDIDAVKNNKGYTAAQRNKILKLYRQGLSVYRNRLKQQNKLINQALR